MREVGQRLVQLLLTEARAKGEREGSGIHFKLNLTYAQTARVGTVREVVSRALMRVQ